MIRLDLKPIIVSVLRGRNDRVRLAEVVLAVSILNNDGYASERFIHVEGRNREYNRIKTWNWQKLLEVFDPPAGSTMSHFAKTRNELEVLLAGPGLRDTGKMHLVECVLGDFAAPRALRAVSLFARRSHGQGTDYSHLFSFVASCLDCKSQQRSFRSSMTGCQTLAANQKRNIGRKCISGRFTERLACQKIVVTVRCCSRSSIHPLCSPSR